MSVNKAILVGKLGKDPELKYTPSGVAVCNFSVATSERYKDRDGQQQEKTEWHNVVIWRQLAEIAGKFLHKGKQVYIEGKIQTRSYDDRDGNKRYITEIVADQMQMLGSKTEGQSPHHQAPQGNQPSQHGGGGGYGRHQQSVGDYADPPINPDDDIPFAFPFWLDQKPIKG